MQRLLLVLPLAACAVTSSGTQLVADGADYLALTDTTLYYSGWDDQDFLVASVPRAGGPRTVLSRTWATALLVAGGEAYAAADNGTRIVRFPRGGGPEETLLTSAEQIFTMAADDERIYFSTWAGVSSV